MTLHDIFLRPLHDLGDHLGENYRGIFSQLYDDTILDQYLTAQFTTDSDWYVDHCEQSDFTGRLLRRCFAIAGRAISEADTGNILDIGSGSGNSILPLLDMFPKCHIVASDLSLHMLLALQQALKEKPAHHKLDLLQLNAEDLDFQMGCFDLMVGIAILHHLHDPSRVIAGAAKILKPGGVAIFSEPFENGNYLLCLAFRMILRDHAAASIPERLKQFLEARIQYVALRAGLDKNTEFLHNHDDKWLFTRQLIMDVAHKNQFRDCQIMPLAQMPDMLTRKTRILLKQHNFQAEELPAWSWEIISDVEASMSPLLRREMPVEAAIILTK